MSNARGPVTDRWSQVRPILSDSNGRFRELQGGIGPEGAIVMESEGGGWIQFTEDESARILEVVRSDPQYDRIDVAGSAGVLGAVQIWTGRYAASQASLLEARQILVGLYDLISDPIEHAEMGIDIAQIHHNLVVLCYRSGRYDLEGAIRDCEEWLARFDQPAAFAAKRYDLAMNHGMIEGSLKILAKETSA